MESNKKNKEREKEKYTTEEGGNVYVHSRYERIELIEKGYLRYM